MTDRPIPSLLADLLASARAIQDISQTAPALDEPVHQNPDLAAILYHFVVIGEIAARLGEDFHTQHPEIPWREVIGHRNVVAHGYDIVDPALLRETILRHVPLLVSAVERILDSYGPPPGAQP